MTPPRRAWAAALAALALVAAGCGGSDDQATYERADVEEAFRGAGLPLRRVPSVGAEQPAMGETSSCGTRYIASSSGAVLSVSVCERADDAADVASGGHMRRANVAVEYAGDDPRVHQRIAGALDALDG